MVDPIGGAGGPQNLSQVNRTQNTKDTDEKRSDRTEEARPSDEVQISQEALALARAEKEAEEAAQKEAAEARAKLAEDQSATLGLGPDFDSEV